MEPGGGHRSGAGSGGAGIDKCTEVANGKHNTKIDKILKHEGDDANNCQKDCQEPPPKPAGGPDGARSESGDDTTTIGDAGHDNDSEEEDENEEEEEENEEGEEDGHGEGAADTK